MYARCCARCFAFLRGAFFGRWRERARKSCLAARKFTVLQRERERDQRDPDAGMLTRRGTRGVGRTPLCFPSRRATFTRLARLDPRRETEIRSRRRERPSRVRDEGHEETGLISPLLFLPTRPSSGFPLAPFHGITIARAKSQRHPVERARYHTYIYRGLRAEFLTPSRGFRKKGR